MFTTNGTKTTNEDEGTAFIRFVPLVPFVVENHRDATHPASHVAGSPVATPRADLLRPFGAVGGGVQREVSDFATADLSPSNAGRHHLDDSAAPREL